jgi:endonuclease YncB( thermonuclease family)
MSRITCPKCHYPNHPSRRACLCGYPLDESRQKQFEELQSKIQKELNFDLGGETSAAQAASPKEAFPTQSADSPKQAPANQAKPIEQKEMEKQAIRQALLIASSDYENSVGKSKINLKKSFVGVSLVIAIVAVLAVLGNFSDLILSSEKSEEKQNNQNQSSLLIDPSLAPKSQNPAANNSDDKTTIEGEVVGVGSGDTIAVLDNNNREYQIKLEGIDAPEMEQEFGREAQKNLFTLVFGKTVQVDLHTAADGTVVGKVMLGDQNLSLEQLKAGLAWHDKTAVLNQWEKEIYLHNETITKKDGYGLWAAANPLPPWAFRKTQSGQEEKNQAAAGDKNGEALKPISNAAQKAKTNVQETNNANNSQATSTDTFPAPRYTKSLPADANRQSPPKVSTSVPDNYERKTTFVSRTATARCKDGTLSFSATRSGSCSRHGGVAERFDGSSAPAASQTDTKNYNVGARGGCYFVNDSGKKVYVDRELCGN